MSPSEFCLVVVLGLVSSLHCVAMCGPIVLAYSVSTNSSQDARRPMLAAHLAYNAGRTITYMALGALAGIAGGTVGFLGRLAGWQNVATIVAGIAMVLAGLTLFGIGPGKNGWRGFALPSRFLKPVGALISSRTIKSKFALGLLLGFLPCGLVYAALMKAVGTAAPLAGALTLLAFGVGTSLALVLVGVGSSAITRRVARWGTTISAITVVLLGALLITRGVITHPAEQCPICNTHHHHSN
jgi:sulfite exporter TauE/SafE